MASKADREVAASIAFSIGLCQIMDLHYSKKKVTQILPLLDNLRATSRGAFNSLVTGLTKKDKTKIADRIMRMKEDGFESAPSFKVYIAFSLAIVSDRFDQLRANNSPKARLFKPVCDALSDLYGYFDQRIKNPEYDIFADQAGKVWYSLAG